MKPQEAKSQNDYVLKLAKHRGEPYVFWDEADVKRNLFHLPELKITPTGWRKYGEPIPVWKNNRLRQSVLDVIRTAEETSLGFAFIGGVPDGDIQAFAQTEPERI